MTRPQLFTIVFFVLLALLLYQIGLILQPFLFPAMWAALLAHWVFPLHRRLTALMSGRDALSAGCLTIGVLTVVVVPVVLMSVVFPEPRKPVRMVVGISDMKNCHEGVE